jgi:hypothetical protein
MNWRNITAISGRSLGFWLTRMGKQGASGRGASNHIKVANVCAGATPVGVVFLDTGKQNRNSGEKAEAL